MMAYMRGYSREPFMEIMTDLLGAKPDADTLKAFAEDRPDRWATACSIFSKLAGYHDKLEIEHNINVQVSQMGDAQLLQALKDIGSELDEINLEETIDQDGQVVYKEMDT
tara:strand:+ start:270 stop:599 length:330 start_codon:yes stop_codon:yes gene_type:complete